MKKKNGVTLSPAVGVDTSSHDFFIVYSSPQSPMQTPWVCVLDYACSWAGGQTSDSGIVSALTTSLHNSGVTYDPGQHYTNPDESVTPIIYDASFNLTSLLNGMNTNITSVQMDCRDFSNILSICAGSLGANGYYNILKRQDDAHFNTNYIHPAGGSWGTANWGYHQVGWYWNSDVADTAADLDGDGYPSTSPSTDLLIIGDKTVNQYLPIFSSDSNVQQYLVSRLNNNQIY